MSNTSQSLASTRINALLDENSFVEIGGYVTARSTDFNMHEKRPQEMALLPDMVSSTENWFTFTARTHPF